MSVNLSELLALPVDERLRLAEVLVESAIPHDVALLVRDFVKRMQRTNQEVEEALRRLDCFDRQLERCRVEARAAVLASGERWPFPLQ